MSEGSSATSWKRIKSQASGTAFLYRRSGRIFFLDYIKYSEPTLRLDAKDEEGFQDVNLMLFHKVIAFDNTDRS